VTVPKEAPQTHARWGVERKTTYAPPAWGGRNKNSNASKNLLLRGHKPVTEKGGRGTGKGALKALHHS